MPRTPLRFLVTAVAIVALAAACTTRFADDDRTEVEFWGTVSEETEAGVRALSDEARAELVDALRLAERERSWRGMLEVLDERPLLEPLADRIEALVDQEIDAGVRAELLTEPGDERLRTLILSSIHSGLAAKREP